MSPPGFLSLPFGKVNAGGAQPVFTTDTAKTSYCLSIPFQTQAEGLYIDSLYNDIHKLIITSYHTFQDAQVRYRH